MNDMFLTIVDVLLLLGLTLRLARLVITDDISQWWLRFPALQWAATHDRDVLIGSMANSDDIESTWRPGWRSKLVSGLGCPWCVGFWIAVLAALSLFLVGGPGHAWEPWRWVAGAFTLNWVVAHIGGPLGDYGYADPEDDE